MHSSILPNQGTHPRDPEADALLFIINPISGGGRALNARRRIESWAHTYQGTVMIKTSNFPGHATRLARHFIESGGRTVIAVGGDGTVREVGLALIGTSARLGILPVGSGNGLARHLGIPLSVKKALQQLELNKEHRIDTGKVNGVPFIMLAGWGLDALIALHFKSSKTRGVLSYVNWVIRSLYSYTPPILKVTHNGEHILEGPAFFLNFANASQFGNEFYIAPDADETDGLLDLVYLPPPKFSEMPKVAWKMRTGKPVFKSLNKMKFRSLQIEGDIQGINLDGEWVQMKGPFQIEVNPLSLTVLV